MCVDDTNNSHWFDMIMGQEIMQELGIYVKLSDRAIRGELPGTFEGWYTPMKYVQELIDTDLNDEIISDEI